MSNIHKFQCGYELFTTLCIVTVSDLAGIMQIQSQVEAKVPSTRTRVFSKTEIFSSVSKKNLRPHVAFSSCMCGRASFEPRHDIIVFENLRFRPSTRIRRVSIFKTLHPGEHIWKPPFSPLHTNTTSLRFQNSPPWRVYLKTSVFGARKRRLRMNGSRIQRKKSLFSKIPGYAWTGSNSAWMNLLSL